MVMEADLELASGRTLHYYDSADYDSADYDSADSDSADNDSADNQTDKRTAVFWQCGTPNVGSPPEPLFAAAAASGLRWVSYDRPAYGGSSPDPGREVASAARDVASIADALGIEQFAVLGHSGGGPHALACGALLPGRVVGVVSVSAPAPHDADGLDWFDGWSKYGAGEQRAAAAGRAELADYLAHAEFDMADFTQADQDALGGRWAWIGEVAGQAIEDGPAGMIDDLLAAARPWGFALAGISVPVLIMHGGQDRMVPSAHGEWLAAHCPGSELRLSPNDGHITILDHVPAALEWLSDRIAR
jgi:pimeloyl-ACP methyl ester carboxylesterase